MVNESYLWSNYQLTEGRTYQRHSASRETSENSGGEKELRVEGVQEDLGYKKFHKIHLDDVQC